MSFWNKIKNAAADATADLKGRVSRYNNANFKDAVMAICALMAGADGTIKAEERSKTAACIGSLDALQAFNPMDLKALFDKHCDAIIADVDFGRVNAMRAVSKIAGKGDETTAAIDVALIIANSDGDFAKEEKEMFKKICQALKVNPADYGV